MAVSQAESVGWQVFAGARTIARRSECYICNSADERREISCFLRFVCDLIFRRGNEV